MEINECYDNLRMMMFFSTVQGAQSLAYTLDDEEFCTQKEIEQLEAEGYSHCIIATRYEIVNSQFALQEIADLCNEELVVI